MGKETKNYNMIDIRCVETVSGAVLEREYYREGWRGVLSGAPRPARLRFADEEERKKHKEQMSRKNHTQMVNTNFEPGDLYVTLTCNVQNEVHSFEDARWMRNNFVRRLRYKYPDAVISMYMGRGSLHGRIHFHALIKGVPWKYVLKQWPYGKGNKIKNEEAADVSGLPDVIAPGGVIAKDGIYFNGLKERVLYDGVDHGADYTGLANYLFDHWTEEQGGHRWKMTRNAKRPEREEDTSEPEEVRQQYTVDNPPPAPKGYIWVESRSTVYGYLYFKYVKTPPKRRRKQASK